MIVRALTVDLTKNLFAGIEFHSLQGNVQNPDYIDACRQDNKLLSVISTLTMGLARNSDHHFATRA